MRRFRQFVCIGIGVSFTSRVQYDLMRVSEAVHYASRSVDGRRREAGEFL